MVFDIIEHLQIRPELKESILEFSKTISRGTTVSVQDTRSE